MDGRRMSVVSLFAMAVLGTACGGRTAGKADGGGGGSTGSGGSTGLGGQTGGGGAQGGAGGAPRTDASGVAGATASPDGAAGTTDGPTAGIDAAGVEVFIPSHPDGGVPLPLLVAPTAPLAAGTSADRIPCYAPLPEGSLAEPLLSFDGAGHLFALESLSPDVALLWQWDDSARRFDNRTPCTREAAWPPYVANGVFGYDVTRGGFVLVGAPGPAFDASAMWTRPAQGGTWSRTTLGGGLLELPRRKGPALTRDTKRKSLVLTGGLFMELPDGTNAWRNVFDASHPAQYPQNGLSRDEAVQAYDPVRGVLLEIGTNRDLSVVVSEYTIATNTWADRTGASPLPEVGGLRVYWNAVAKRVELIGWSGKSHQNFVWHWDAGGGTFILDAPAAGSPNPGDLLAGAAAFDEVGGRVAVLFEGGTAPPRELWTWTLATKTWARLTPGRWPVSWPGVGIGGEYASAAAVYDVARGRLVSMAANDRNEVETLEWDGTSPSFVDPRADAGAPWPRDLTGISAAYDRERGRTIMFGLRDLRQSEIWEWQPAAGKWIDRSVPGDQVPRNPNISGVSSMTYDARRGRLLLWGGSFNRAGRYLWEWDPDYDVWQERDVPATVRARFGDVPGIYSREHGAIVFDESRGRAVVVSAGPTIAEWDGDAWSLPAMPAATSYAGKVVATYDPRRKRVVILEVSAQAPTKRRLWSWNGANLVDETPPVLATLDLDLTDVVSLAYDWKRGNLVIVGRRATPDPFLSRGFGVWELSATPP